MESDGFEPSTFILVSHKETCQWRDSVLIETSVMLYQSELRFHRSALKVVYFSAKFMKHHEKMQVEDM